MSVDYQIHPSSERMSFDRRRDTLILSEYDPNQNLLKCERIDLAGRPANSNFNIHHSSS